MNIRAKKMFKSGIAYAKSASFLNESAGSDPELLVPSQVNAALALELYFKSLYQLIEQEDFKVKGKHSHDFYRIYKALPSEYRERMNKRFDDLISKRDKSDIKQMKLDSNVNISLKLESLIQNWSRVFVDMRYIYEAHKGTYIMILFPEIAQVVMKEVYDLDGSILS
ncbi:hypothetical protein AB4543_05400 [Vibrio splendidus]